LLGNQNPQLIELFVQLEGRTVRSVLPRADQLALLRHLAQTPY